MSEFDDTIGGAMGYSGEYREPYSNSSISESEPDIAEMRMYHGLVVRDTPVDVQECLVSRDQTSLRALKHTLNGDPSLQTVVVTLGFLRAPSELVHWVADRSMQGEWCPYMLVERGVRFKNDGTPPMFGRIDYIMPGINDPACVFLMDNGESAPPAIVRYLRFSGYNNPDAADAELRALLGEEPDDHMPRALDVSTELQRILTHIPPRHAHRKAA